MADEGCKWVFFSHESLWFYWRRMGLHGLTCTQTDAWCIWAWRNKATSAMCNGRWSKGLNFHVSDRRLLWTITINLIWGGWICLVRTSLDTPIDGSYSEACLLPTPSGWGINEAHAPCSAGYWILPVYTVHKVSEITHVKFLLKSNSHFFAWLAGQKQRKCKWKSVITR